MASQEVDVHSPKVTLAAALVDCTGLVTAQVVTATTVNAGVVKATGSVASPSFVPL